MAFQKVQLIKMTALTKIMSFLTKNMGHEKYMVVFIGFFTKMNILTKC